MWIYNVPASHVSDQMWPSQMLEKDAEITNLGRICEQEDRKQMWGGDVVLYDKVKYR